MRTWRSDKSGKANRQEKQQAAIEPLEPRQLLSISPFIVSASPGSSSPGVHVPFNIDLGSVSGTVSDSSGAGIGGALVVIAPAKPTGTTTGTVLPPEPVLFARTDSSGKFSLPKVPVGTYTATAHKEGFNNATSAAFSVTKGNNTDVSLTLTAIATGSVNGSVVDSSGKGIAGATVVLSPSSPGTTQPAPILPVPVLVATTDTSGNYSFGKVPTGSYTATAFKAGYQKATSASFTVTAGKTTTVPALTLTAIPAPTFGRVTGTITDTSGKPLAGALVEISPAPTSTGTGGTSSTPTMPRGSFEIAITNSSGQYTFNRVRTGTYVITAFAKGYQRGTSAPFTVNQGSNTAPTVQLAALPAPVVGSVSGLVTDSAGKPIAGAFVELSPAPTSGSGGTTLTLPVRALFTTTDSNGQYNFAKVPGGTYVASAIARGYQKATSAPFTVVQGANKGPTLVLPAVQTPVTGTVAGKVTDSSGKPLANAYVVISPAPSTTGQSSNSGSTIFPWPGPGPVQFAKTDSNGQYTFNNVPVGSYVVTAYAIGYQRATSAAFTVNQGNNTAPTLALMLATTPTPIPML